MVGQVYTGGDIARTRRQAIEQCVKIVEEEASTTADGAGEIYIARKIAERLRALLPSR
jgi:hypothetical protein